MAYLVSFGMWGISGTNIDNDDDINLSLLNKTMNKDKDKDKDHDIWELNDADLIELTPAAIQMAFCGPNELQPCYDDNNHSNDNDNNYNHEVNRKVVCWKKAEKVITRAERKEELEKNTAD